MEMMGRRLRGKSNPLGVRRVVSVSLTHEQSIALTSLCRTYGIVDEDGAPRGVEALRFLMVVGLTRGAPAVRRAAVAARVNAKMLLGAMGIRLSSALGATTASGPRPTWVPRRLNLHFDASLAAQMERLGPAYRDGHGVILDARMAMDLAKLGLSDPDLPAVLAWYSPWMNRMRERLGRCEEQMHRIVEAAASELASMIDGRTTAEEAMADVGG